MTNQRKRRKKRLVHLRERSGGGEEETNTKRKGEQGRYLARVNKNKRRERKVRYSWQRSHGDNREKWIKNLTLNFVLRNNRESRKGRKGHVNLFLLPPLLLTLPPPLSPPFLLILSSFFPFLPSLYTSFLFSDSPSLLPLLLLSSLSFLFLHFIPVLF